MSKIQTSEPFCVYLTIYSGEKLPSFYIGSKDTASVLLGYRGSVSSSKFKSLWQDELLNNPLLFETKILSYHKTRKEAFDEEERVQRRLDAVDSEDYINMAYANGKFSMHKRNHTKESKEKMRVSRERLLESKPLEWHTAKAKKISETKKSIISNMTLSEREAFSIKMSEAQTRRPENVKSNHAKNISDGWARQTLDEKTAISKKFSIRAKKQFSTLDAAGRMLHAEKTSLGLALMTPSEKENMKAKRALSIANKTEDEKRKWIDKWKLTNSLKSAEEKKAIRQKMIQTNNNKNAEEKLVYAQKLSKALKGKCGSQVICPHCGKEGSNKAMGRWHFDNCKKI